MSSIIEKKETSEEVHHRQSDKANEKEKHTNHENSECVSPSCPKNFKSKLYDYVGSIAQAPRFLQDNQFILHGYRINFDSPKKIFKRLGIFYFICKTWLLI